MTNLPWLRKANPEDPMFLELDGEGATYQQLTRALKTAIPDDHASAGTRLPPTRAPAQELGISRITVLSADDQLRAKGHLQSRVGSGSYVSALQPTLPLHPAKVALSDGKAVGTIALRDMGNFQAALRKMFVKASHRGKEHAVATKLLNHLIARARTGGVQDVFLGTTERFLAAHRFYEKNAFKLVAPESLPLAFPRMSLDTRFYHRTLRRDDT